MASIASLSDLISVQTDGTAQMIGVSYISRNSTTIFSLVQRFSNSMWIWNKSRKGTGETVLTTTASIPTRSSFSAVNGVLQTIIS